MVYSWNPFSVEVFKRNESVAGSWEVEYAKLLRMLSSGKGSSGRLSGHLLHLTKVALHENLLIDINILFHLHDLGPF